MQKRSIVAITGAAIASFMVMTAPIAHAQEAPKGALSQLVQRLAETKIPQRTRASSAVRFKPSGKRLLLDDVVNSLSDKEEQRNALRQILTQGATALEGALNQEGHTNDIAAAFAVFVATQWGAATGKEVPDAASDVLIAQINSLFSDPSVAKVSDADKQRFYEYCLFLSVFTSATKETATGTDSQKAVRGVAAQIFKTLVPVDPAKIDISAKGLTLIGGGGASVPAASSGSGNLSAGSPAGWEKKAEEGGVTYTRSVATSEGGLGVSVLMLSAAARKGTPEALAPVFFDELVRPRIPAPGLDKELRPEVFRRYVGNDLRCSFMSISRVIKKSSLDYLGTSQEMHLYAVESGGVVTPILVVLNGHDGSGSDGKLIKSSVRNEWLEDFLSHLSGVTSGKPLYTIAELAGTYKMSSGTTGLQYFNIYTGASAGYAYVTRGSTLSLQEDGTFEVMNYGASGIGGPANFAVEKGKGKFQLVKDGTGVLLKMTDTSTSKSFDEKLAGAFTLPGMAGKVLILLPNKMSVNTANVAASAEHYLTKPPVK